MKKIAVFGAGGFGREVHDMIEQINSANKQYDFIGFFDDGIEKGTIVNDYPVLGGVAELNQIESELCVAMAIGNPGIKRKIVEKIFNPKISFPTLVHPNVFIGNSKFNKIGEGCIICAGNIITVNIVIEDFVILNLSCTVGHDTIIGRFSSFMPTVNISGEINIGECVYVGTGAKIINQLNIGENSVIGSGAVVTTDLPANCTAVGVPAKVIKIRGQEKEITGGGGKHLLIKGYAFYSNYSPAISLAS
ncbi:putative acetyltransferase EpsM [bioreactor metagenome]|uniref:Putative acetyltransferase EpsM n=1 Tax=bioreactor metagenome TaxID=1076179 RepID=A0A644VQ71_9ZZZZ